MKNVILTVLKVIGVVLLVLIVLIAALLFWLSRRPFVPNSYTKTVETGGTIEASGPGALCGQTGERRGPGGLEGVRGLLSR